MEQQSLRRTTLISSLTEEQNDIISMLLFLAIVVIAGPYLLSNIGWILLGMYILFPTTIYLRGSNFMRHNNLSTRLFKIIFVIAYTPLVSIVLICPFLTVDFSQGQFTSLLLIIYYFYYLFQLLQIRLHFRRAEATRRRPIEITNNNKNDMDPFLDRILNAVFDQTHRIGQHYLSKGILTKDYLLEMSLTAHCWNVLKELWTTKRHMKID